MDFSHYTDLSVDLAVALVNAFPKQADPPSAAELQALISETLQGVGARSLEQGAGRLTDRDVRRIGRLAGALREVFEAESPDDAVPILNRLLVDAGTLPQITRHDDEDWHIHYVPPGAPFEHLLTATTAMGLAIVVSEYGLERLGVCDVDDCADVYVDTSRNRSRRYCSEGCTNRANVAAYRARKRHETPADGT